MTKQVSLRLPVLNWKFRGDVTRNQKYIECYRPNSIVNLTHLMLLFLGFLFLLLDGMTDIGYNFMIGGDGNVYEGRGWEFWGNHTCCSFYNRNAYGVGFLGHPTEPMLNTAKELIKCGVEQVCKQCYPIQVK